MALVEVEAPNACLCVHVLLMWLNERIQIFQHQTCLSNFLSSIPPTIPWANNNKVLKIMQIMGKTAAFFYIYTLVVLLLIYSVVPPPYIYIYIYTLILQGNNLTIYVLQTPAV